MTLSMLPQADPSSTRDVEADWAVVEIRRDGSLGRAELVRAVGPRAAAARLGRAPTTRRPVLFSSELSARLGLALAAEGRLVEAGRAFALAVERAPTTGGRRPCEGHLALAEACRGNLRQALGHAERGLVPGADVDADVVAAHLAQAWILVERDEHEEASHHLALAAGSHAREDVWTATVHTLLEARLLLPTRPDSAVQLLAHVRDELERHPVHRQSSWAHAAIAVARAEALLALGEPQRALAALTPVPAGAAAEGSVTAAGACLEIGDLRGADAVLASVRDLLEKASLATQLQAWLLEARIAEQRGRAERVVQLVDRALRAASCEDLRAPLRREWPWLRLQVERDHATGRTYRDFLGCLHDVPVAQQPGHERRLAMQRTADVLGPHLTRREADVLDLLARMYSTDEIATTLFVSANTVKTHLKGIYAKLCVNRRADAVRRGRQLGLC